MSVRAIVYCLSLVLCTSANAAFADDSYLDVQSLDSNCIALLRISEQQIVHADETWPNRMVVQFAPVADVLDSLRAKVPAPISASDISVLATCSMPGELRVHIVCVDVDGTDLTRAFFMITERESTIIATGNYAWLYTSCSETKVALSDVTEEGRVAVAATRHTFDCKTDEVLASQREPMEHVTLLLDGRIQRKVVVE
jgi:hypothetical protein